MADQQSPKTVVFGLDGACFHLLNRWLDAGELPAIGSLLDDGVSGDLEAVLPPVTSPNWKAYATGKNPGKLGIFWWFNVDTDAQETYVPTDRYHAETEFWEIMAEEDGAQVGVIGVPNTHPPTPLDGFVVSGAPDGENEGFTHPPSLEAELRERFDYRVVSQHHRQERSAEAYEEMLELVDQRFEAAAHLLESPDFDVSFLQVTTYYLNNLHHSIWDDEYTLKAWKIVDDHVASFRDRAENVVLMSDHGMAEIETVFRINQWLQREGYLATDASTAELLHRLGVRSDPLKVLLDRANKEVPGIDLKDAVSRALPAWFVDNLPNDDGELTIGTHDRLRWDESEVIASGLGPVYLNVDRDDPRYEELREELVRRLEGLTDPQGRLVADGVYRGEEIYDGPYVEEGPDLVVDQTRGTYISQGYGRADVFSDSYHRWEAVNDSVGLFAAAGPDFAEGTVEDLGILDLAPTLLHLHGCAVPSDMDGTVRTDLFDEASEASRREVTYDQEDRPMPSP